MPAGSGVEVAKAYVTVIPSMQGSQAAITQGMTSAMTGAGNAGGAAAGAAASSGIAAKLSKFVAPAAVLAAFAAVGKQCADAFEAVEEGTNNLLTATGATGEQAEQLESVYKEVAQNVVGDFGDIGAAVGELNTRFGLTGDALEAASEQTMQYAKVAGVDAVQAVQDVSRMMNNAGIDASQYGEYLDKLTVAAQQSGIDVGTLTESVTKNAASFEQLGFSTDESIAMLASFEKSGVNTSAVLTGMRKGIANWAKEGKSAGEGFKEFVQGVQDGSVTASDANELFGSKAGAALFSAAQKGQLDFEEMYAAITEGSDGALESVYEDTLTIGDKLGLMKQNVMEAGAGIAEPFVDGLSSLLDMALPMVQGFADGVTGLMDTLGESFAPAAEALGGLFETLTQSTAVQNLLATIGGTISTIAQTIGGVLAPAIQILSPIIAMVVDVVSIGLSTVLNLLNGTVSALVTAVMPYIQQLADFLAPYLEQLKAWFEENMPAIQAVVTTVVGVISGVVAGALPVIVGFITTAIDTIKRVIGTISTIVATVQGVFARVKNAIVTPIQTARDTIKGIVDKIKGFFSFTVPKPNVPLPHFKITPSGWKVGDLLQGKIPTLSIDWYASGGIFNAPSIIGVGEAGPEAVLPLSRLDDFFEVDGGDTFNLYINGAQVNSDEAIESRFYSLLTNLQAKYRLARG